MDHNGDRDPDWGFWYSGPDTANNTRGLVARFYGPNKVGFIIVFMDKSRVYPINYEHGFVLLYTIVVISSVRSGFMGCSLPYYSGALFTNMV